MEIIVTRPAKEVIRELSIKNNIKPEVRIYAEQASCCRAKFAIAFDNLKSDDEVSYSDEIAFITDKEYMPKYAKTLLVDYCKDGFMIEAYVPAERGCHKSSGEGCSGCSGCNHK